MRLFIGFLLISAMLQPRLRAEAILSGSISHYTTDILVSFVRFSGTNFLLTTARLQVDPLFGPYLCRGTLSPSSTCAVRIAGIATTHDYRSFDLIYNSVDYSGWTVPTGYNGNRLNLSLNFQAPVFVATVTTYNPPIGGSLASAEFDFSGGRFTMTGSATVTAPDGTTLVSLPLEGAGSVTYHERAYSDGSYPYSSLNLTFDTAVPEPATLLPAALGGVFLLALGFQVRNR